LAAGLCPRGHGAEKAGRRTGRQPGKKVSIFFSFSFSSLFTCLQTIPNKISKPNQNKIIPHHKIK
jgi:hypothetical protein